jgi:NAD(P)-dependent dehydrogenase (short-subunit alcohol dehydrogenase family)
MGGADLIGGIMPIPVIAAYQAAKAALEAVSDSMRIEFSPFGVHVSAIAPASISTPMLKRSSERLNRIVDALPKSRLAIRWCSATRHLEPQTQPALSTHWLKPTGLPPNADCSLCSSPMAQSSAIWPKRKMP